MRDTSPSGADPHGPYTVYKSDVSYFSGKQLDSVRMS
jgi:hypothetical protein